MSDYFVVENDQVLREVLAGPHGPVAAALARMGARVETAAKQYASGFGGGPQVRTGRLRAGIAWQLGSDSRGLFAQIGTNVEYGPYVELGTDRMLPRPFLRPALGAVR